MRMHRYLVLGFALLATACSTASAAPRLRRGPTSPKLFKARTPARPKAAAVHIDDERVLQIQTALIKSGYLTGEPTGSWDAVSQSAMAKLQGNNGWQTKVVPDARALNKLGLGTGSKATAEPAGNGTAAAAPQTPHPAEAIPLR